MSLRNLTLVELEEQALWNSGEVPYGVSWMLSGPHARVW